MVNPTQFIIALACPMTVTNSLSTTPFCCGVPGAVYSKIIPKSFLSDSVSSTLFSPAISHLIILTWISCLAFKAFIQSIIDLTCSFFFSCYTLLLHQPTLPNVVFLPCLVFSLMRYQNTSFLQACYFYLDSSLGNFSVLFSPMSNLGNC